MVFRDDREGLRARVFDLECELETSRKQAEQACRLEGELASARAQLDRIERELGGRARRSVRQSGSPFAGGALLIVALLGMINLIRMTSRAMPPMSSHTASIAPAPCAPGDPLCFTAATRPTVGAASIAVAEQVTRVHWHASVQSVRDVDLRAGEACEVSAALHGVGPRASTPDVTITCGDVKLYDSDERADFRPLVLWSAHEGSGPYVGRFVLEYRDQGSRRGRRSQVTIDTAKGTAVVWSDSQPTFQVELDVERASELRDDTTPL